jgi:CRISPR-associated protein (TIGR03986 family)
MSWPRHRSPRSKARMASAPYNFIPLPLPEQVVKVSPGGLPDHGRYHADRLTGHVDCKLVTRSPLYIRCAVPPEFFTEYGEKRDVDLTLEQKAVRANFFHHGRDDLPVIPGSSLRGMVRSLVEIACYGKMQWVSGSDNGKITYRAVAASKSDPLAEPYRKFMGKFGSNVRAGYLVRQGDDWHVQPAKTSRELGIDSDDKFFRIRENDIPEGAVPGLKKIHDDGYAPQYHKVSFNGEARLNNRVHRKQAVVTSIGAPDGGKNFSGTLVCTGNMMETKGGNTPRSNHVIIPEQNLIEDLLEIPSQVVSDYRGTLTEFQKSDPFDEHRGCLLDKRPVFYVTEKEKVIWFGHCPNFRVPARTEGGKVTAPLDLVPKELRDTRVIDLAEAIFGFTAEKNRPEHPDGYAGRVFFTDAGCVSDGDVWLTQAPVELKVLGSPKPSCFQHYLVQDPEHDHDPDRKPSLAHYGTPAGETVIRGHKLYWHKGSNPSIQNDNQKASPTQFTRVRPVRPGVVFTSRIYFENLTQFELGALLWVLQLPENCYHKLGMGKPLGMGAVRITPELFINNRVDSRYRMLFEGQHWHEADEQGEILKYQSAFEQGMLERLSEPAATGGFKEIRRIRMLLKMLEWRDTGNQLMEYMDIDRFKERLVLPDPLVTADPESGGLMNDSFEQRRDDRQRRAGPYGAVTHGATNSQCQSRENDRIGGGQNPNDRRQGQGRGSGSAEGPENQAMKVAWRRAQERKQDKKR